MAILEASNVVGLAGATWPRRAAAILHRYQLASLIFDRRCTPLPTQDLVVHIYGCRKRYGSSNGGPEHLLQVKQARNAVAHGHAPHPTTHAHTRMRLHDGNENVGPKNL